jgi:hypothetical protein
MRLILAEVNPAIQRTGENKTLQQDRDFFSKNWPLAKIRCFALMNAHTPLISDFEAAPSMPLGLT